MVEQYNIKKNLYLGYITVFLDVIGFSLIVPILPYLSKELNATASQEGILFSTYCITQLVSLLYMGYYSDFYGRKMFLLLSLAGSCLGAILQGLSRNMWSLIVWRAATGLFAGSPIVTQALIADCTTTQERNKYLAILEAFISAGYIVGPAIGGFLGQVSYSFPLYCAGVVAGIAFVFAAIYLDESNKDVHRVYSIRREAKGKSKEEKEKSKIQIKAVQQEIKERRKSVKVKLDKLMILCFIFEFANRWAVNAYDSRYGYYLSDDFGVSSLTYSTIVCAQSAFNCVLQAFGYNLVVHKWKVPIVYAAFVGTIIEIIGYILMASAPNLAVNVLGSTLLWVGYTFSIPTSTSIISTSNAPEVQGQVLSWNNFCAQSSYIACPLVLSAIYNKSHRGTYYFCIIPTVIATIVSGVFCLFPNAKSLGKATTHELPIQDSVKGDNMNEEKVSPKVDVSEVSQGEIAQGGVSQSEISQSGVSQSEISQSGVSQSEIAQTGVSQSEISQSKSNEVTVEINPQ